MYDESILLLESPEFDSISVCVHCEKEGLFELGERINARFELAYMNGYNWDALIRYYVSTKDPALADEVEPNPEAGMYEGYMSHSAQNLEKMKRFELHIREMVADEAKLMKFIEDHYDKIEWD